MVSYCLTKNKLYDKIAVFKVGLIKSDQSGADYTVGTVGFSNKCVKDQELVGLLEPRMIFVGLIAFSRLRVDFWQLLSNFSIFLCFYQF